MRPISMALVPLLLAAGFVVPAVSAPTAAPRCGGQVATIVGTAGVDHLVGTPGHDVIAALGNNDVVRGRGGDDVICGGPGFDVLEGMAGDDRVFGGAGHDWIRSSKGSDHLRGGFGDDEMSSHSPQPTRVYGGPGSDGLSNLITEEPGYALDGGPGLDGGQLRVDPEAATPGPLVEIRRGPGTITRAGVVTGDYRSIEFLGLQGDSGFSYYGTNARDFVFAASGPTGFRAETYGGPDRIDSSEGDDYIDAGDGDDFVKAGLGQDTCLHAEIAKGCELTGP